MFQQPIRAQSGVYVPTIEQIMNFYQGGFDPSRSTYGYREFFKSD